jgi:phage repressor protein C with HTH and peptisase S24 domain
MLKHADIWRAIDQLAARNNLSPSGLARKSGLSPTLFNPSKRSTGKRKRWPSTESIARILTATNTTLDTFVALAANEAPASRKIPLLGALEAGREGYFDDNGYPAGKGWDEIVLPGATDPHAFALEIVGKSAEPIYREGDRVILSPVEKPRRGDRVVVRTMGGDILVRVLGREGAQKVELAPFNPDYQPLTLPRADIVWMYRIVWASQ